ncbi:MAG: flagellar export protein FliJ [Acidobacteria bacterium]|nr:flagellar export protein FliJ [Acidobacteriota bacterium]MBI3663009.1 flagellar export protein FliJ [Acidobacteriota bacterium]
MAFRFPLQSLLRLRLALETRERLLLESLNRQLAQAAQDIETLSDEDLRARRSLGELMGQGITGGDIQFAIVCEEGRTRMKQILGKKLAELSLRRDAQREIFQAAQRARKVLESLRDRLFEQYRIRENRREQQRLDDLNLLRRWAAETREQLPQHPAKSSC